MTGAEQRHFQMGTSRSGRLAIAAACALVALSAMPAAAQRIENSVAVFAALDKVTAKISRLEVPLNETRSFGALKVTPRVCYTRDPREPPRTSTFVEIDEILIDGKQKRIFSGWMFAESPGLNPLVHPVFDLWLTGCSQPTRTAPSAKGPNVSPEAAGGGPTIDPGAPPPRRRVPR